MYAHRKASKGSSDAALLWLNAAETWIDINKIPTTKTHLVSPENQNQVKLIGSANLDFSTYLVFLGPDSKAIFKQYGELTGFTPIPPLFSIGYHQCRWNYINEEDVLSVDAGFDQYEIPYDTIWLDIEYTDDKQYFTWDPRNFPNPEKMLEKLDIE